MIEKEYMNEEELWNLITEVEENEMVQAPFYLKDSILEKARNESDVIAPITRKSANMQLLSFSFKIMLATAAAILILITVPSELNSASAMKTQSVESGISFTTKINGKSNEVCDLLNRITNQLTGQLSSQLSNKED